LDSLLADLIAWDGPEFFDIVLSISHSIWMPRGSGSSQLNPRLTSPVSSVTNFWHQIFRREWWENCSADWSHRRKAEWQRPAMKVKSRKVLPEIMNRIASLTHIELGIMKGFMAKDWKVITGLHSWATPLWRIFPRIKAWKK
jgi:hypothetical protein